MCLMRYFMFGLQIDSPEACNEIPETTFTLHRMCPHPYPSCVLQHNNFRVPHMSGGRIPEPPTRPLPRPTQNACCTLVLSVPLATRCECATVVQEMASLRGALPNAGISIANATPAAHSSGSCHGTGEVFSFVQRPFERGVPTAARSSVLSLVPRHCARSTDFLRPKSRKLHALLSTPTANCRYGSIPIEHCDDLLVL